MVETMTVRRWRTMGRQNFRFKGCLSSVCGLPFIFKVCTHCREKPKGWRIVDFPDVAVRQHQVCAQLKVAHSLWFILVAHLDILVTNYFDDFVVLCRESEASHLTSVINAVFRLLGWDFAEEGPKAPAFAGSALALGVRLDVSSMHLGKVWIDNTESRKTDLSSCIRDVLHTGDLHTADALRLRGRMQFTSGQLFGRLSRSTLNKVTHHAYRSCKSKKNRRTFSCRYLCMISFLSQANPGWFQQG